MRSNKTAQISQSKMAKILVPCDFSKQAINAYRFALDIAARAKGIVYVVNNIQLPVVHDTFLMPMLSFEKGLVKDMKMEVEKRFNKILDKYNTEGVKVVFDVVFGGVVDTMQDYVQKQSIDLIVIGSHGASGLKEYTVGSYAEKMVRDSTVPVLVIKEYFKGPINKIVFPNSLETEDQEDLVMKVKALQSFFNAHLHIVWINTPANFHNDIVTHSRLESFAKLYTLKNYSLAVFNETNEETGILQYTEMVKGNIIAMGTNGRRGISHLLNGSKAEDIVNHGKTLIWTYRIKKEK